MISENIRRLPIVEGSRLVGIVSDKDIYHAIVKSESLIISLIEDEILMNHIKENNQLLACKLDQVVAKGSV